MISVLIQSGHTYPREPGHESETGTVREQEFSTKMGKRLVTIFAADKRFRVRTCGGDVPDGWVGDLFLSLHADGGSAEAHGYSFGWPANGRDPGRGPELAKRLAAEWSRIGHPGGHHSDNYTDGMRGYYGWSRVVAPTEVLVEHGFLTNPGERSWMFSHVDEMAQATYRAILNHYGLKPVRSAALATVTLGDVVVADGLLLTARVCRRIGYALRASGRSKPFTARVEGGPVIAHGRLWVGGRASWLMRQVSRAVRQGHVVVLDGVVRITPHKEG